MSLPEGLQGVCKAVLFSDLQINLQVSQPLYLKGDKQMKKINRLCLAALLTLTFALSASAGQIECGVTAAPPPPSQSRAGEMECGKLGVEFTEVAYTVLQDVLAVL
jgi:hypothetical protein